MGYIAIQMAEVRNKLAGLFRGECITIEGEKDWRVEFTLSGDFIVNNINVGKSLKCTVDFLHKKNFEYYFRKSGIMHRYWRDRPMDIRKYYLKPVDPKEFECSMKEIRQ